MSKHLPIHQGIKAYHSEELIFVTKALQQTVTISNAN